jgi:hypothetical protein
VAIFPEGDWRSEGMLYGTGHFARWGLETCCGNLLREVLPVAEEGGYLLAGA